MLTALFGENIDYTYTLLATPAGAYQMVFQPILGLPQKNL